LNIHDVVDANLLVLEDPRARLPGVNVGGGRAWSVNEFAQIAARAFRHRDRAQALGASTASATRATSARTSRGCAR
jgi:dTDP-L-rhamnose 4-epimerase